MKFDEIMPVIFIITIFTCGFLAILSVRQDEKKERAKIENIHPFVINNNSVTIDGNFIPFERISTYDRYNNYLTVWVGSQTFAVGYKIQNPNIKRFLAIYHLWRSKQ